MRREPDRYTALYLDAVMREDGSTTYQPPNWLWVYCGVVAVLIVVGIVCS